MAEKFAGLLLEMELAKGVAGIVDGDAMGEFGADVVDFGDLDEKFGKLEDAAAEGDGFVAES